jgi:hypothetical protein
VNEPIRVKVDVTNPGQFFACCGLVELAQRVWSMDLCAWFVNDSFQFSVEGSIFGSQSLAELLSVIARLPLTQLDPEDHGASPLNMSVSEGLRLDWWQDSGSDGQALKPWAGTQGAYRIAKAMQRALPSTSAERCLDSSMIVFDPEDPVKKVEPFYFDARRGARPFSRDIGFAPDALQMTTLAFPAVEFLCLVGLQRCRPRPAPEPRKFDYFTWSEPLSVNVLPVAVAGLLPGVGAEGYRFENAFRTDRRKHKAFSPATPLSRRSP